MSDQRVFSEAAKTTHIVSATDQPVLVNVQHRHELLLRFTNQVLLNKPELTKAKLAKARVHCIKLKAQLAKLPKEAVHWRITAAKRWLMVYALAPTRLSIKDVDKVCDLYNDDLTRRAEKQNQELGLPPPV